MGLRVLNTAISLFKEWNEHKIQYCHWKSNEHLLEGLSGKTDLDILVGKLHVEDAEKCLRSFGYIKMVSQFGSRYPYVEDWIGCDKEEGKLIHIHLHYQILTGHRGLKEYTLPLTERVLSTRILDDKYPIYIIEPNLELVLLYIRIGLKAEYMDIVYGRFGKYHLSEQYLLEVTYLKQRIVWKKVQKILNKYFISFSDEMFQIMTREKYDSEWLIHLHKIVTKVFSINNRVGKNIFVLKPYYKAAIYFRRKLRKFLISNLIIRKTFGTEKGVTIAFLGQDGAGKSTISDEVQSWLSWKVDAKKNYLGSGEHYHSWQKKVVEVFAKSENKILKVIRVGALLSNLKHLAIHNYKSIASAKKFADKGGVVIFDRFPQIQYIGINDGPKIRPMINKINSNIIKKYITYCADKEETYLKQAVNMSPDLVIKLILPVDVSLQRKPEEDKDIVKHKYEIIYNLDFKGSECISIDATLPYEEELVQIHNAIWNLLLHKQQT